MGVRKLAVQTLTVSINTKNNDFYDKSQVIVFEIANLEVEYGLFFCSDGDCCTT